MSFDGVALQRWVFIEVAVRLGLVASFASASIPNVMGLLIQGGSA